MCTPADVPVKPTAKARKMIKSYESRALVQFFEFLANGFDDLVNMRYFLLTAVNLQLQNVL